MREAVITVASLMVPGDLNTGRGLATIVRWQSKSVEIWVSQDNSTHTQTILQVGRAQLATRLLLTYANFRDVVQFSSKCEKHHKHYCVYCVGVYFAYNCCK